MRHIVACDETWEHHYTSESKKASMGWRKPEEEALRKAKARLSAGKVLMTIFWDCRGILLVDFLHRCAYYCQLLDEVKLAYRKRRDMPIRSAILLHDNAQPFTASLTQKKMDQTH